MAASGLGHGSGVPESVQAPGTRLGPRTWNGRGRKDLRESAPSCIRVWETEFYRPALVWQ